MLNGKKCQMDKMSNGTKRRIDTMSKVRKAEWDIMSNGTKRRIEVMSKEERPIGTKCRMVQKNVESKQCRNQKTYCNLKKWLLCIINL